MTEGSLQIIDTRTSYEYEIPIHHNTVPASAFRAIKGSSADSQSKRKGNGLKLYDPGLTNTAIAESDMTLTDADKNLIIFRGYTPEQLQNYDFEDCVHLLVWGQLPTPSQRSSLCSALSGAMSNVPDSVITVINSYPASSPPMPMIIGGLSAYIAANPQSMPSYSGVKYHDDHSLISSAIINALAVFAVVVGATECRRKGRQFTRPSGSESFYQKIFTMMGLVDPLTSKPDPNKVSCMRRWGIAIMDHGLTNSTFSLHVTASTLADPISALISSLASSSGPLHFGAQEAGYKTIVGLGGPENVPKLMEKVKRGEHRLHGFGHRTFKGVDPRVSRALLLLKELDAADSQEVNTAKEMERIAAADDWFQKRKIYPNADLYGQFLYVALGMDPEWSPAMLFLQRLPGLMAHWREIMSKDIKLLRPADLYIGPTSPQVLISPNL